MQEKYAAEADKYIGQIIQSFGIENFISLLQTIKLSCEEVHGHTKFAFGIGHSNYLGVSKLIELLEKGGFKYEL